MALPTELRANPLLPDLYCGNSLGLKLHLTTHFSPTSRHFLFLASAVPSIHLECPAHLFEQKLEPSSRLDSEAISSRELSGTTPAEVASPIRLWQSLWARPLWRVGMVPQGQRHLPTEGESLPSFRLQAPGCPLDAARSCAQTVQETWSRSHDRGVIMQKWSFWMLASDLFCCCCCFGVVLFCYFFHALNHSGHLPGPSGSWLLSHPFLQQKPIHRPPVWQQKPAEVGHNPGPLSRGTSGVDG